MNKNLKYIMPEEKYTSDEFLEVFKERSDKLNKDYPTLTVEEARERFSRLFDDCPIGLHIDPFGLMNKLENHFFNWHILGNNGTKRVFKIPVGNIPENEVDSFIEKIVKEFKNGTL